jgi:TRAP-type mannitol/chloroaromatic compound transport system permease small subunit
MATGGGGTADVARPRDGLGRLVYSGDRLLRPVEGALNLVAAVAVLFLMLLGCVQIVLRIRRICVPWTDLCMAGINQPLFGYIDMIQLAMPILAVLGIAYAQRYGVHIRMDILIERLRGRTLWLVETFNSLVTLGIVVLLTRFSWVFFRDAYTSGDSTIDAQYLTWPSKLLVPISLAILALRMLVQLLGSVRLAIDPDREPVGVVVPQSVAEQAQKEIRDVMGDEAVSQAIAQHMADDEERRRRR